MCEIFEIFERFEFLGFCFVFEKSHSLEKDTITHFRNLSDLELQRGKEKLEQMKSRHESMARSEAEIRDQSVSQI